MHIKSFKVSDIQTSICAVSDVCAAEDEYAAWNERYHEASVSMVDREAKIEAISDELEHDLRLLGATAIEDRLQDGVPETIADLKRAGIKIWVATGDKLETAIGGCKSQPFVFVYSDILSLSYRKEYQFDS